MAKVYNFFNELLMDANAGTLEWGDATKNTGIGGYYFTKGFDVPELQTILNIVHKTEPNTDWVRGGWLQVTTDGKNIIYNPKHGNQPNGPTAPSLIPNTPIPKILPGISSVNDLLNVLGQPQLWVRIAEFLIGALLVGIGLASVTGTANVVSKIVRSKI